MGKIQDMPRNEIIRILLKNGFEKAPSNGPHMKFKKFDSTINRWRVTFVSHAPKINRYIVKCIIRQSGLPEEEFY